MGPSESPTESDGAETDLYRWTCPLCHASRLVSARGSGRVVQALRSHVHSSSGGRHGETHAYPEGIDEDELARYVERLD